MCYHTCMNKTQMNFATSNLSKIKPKLRTQGNVTGNFGRPKTKAGSPISGLGVTKVKVVNVTTPDEYLNKMYYVLDNATDLKMKQFAYTEIRKILVQRGQWQNWHTKLHKSTFICYNYKVINKQMPTYNFTGDAVTFIGLVGVISTAIIVITVFRTYFNSPFIK